jgi:flagellar biosynthesis/type III secretory pathway protein FliH
MSFLLWQRGQLGIGSGRQVFRAAEVPLLRSACELVDRLEAMRQDEATRIDAALEAGRRQGWAEGEAMARQAAEAHRAEEMVRLQQQSEAVREEARREVATLALQVVRKLLGGLPDGERQAALALQAARELLPARTWRLAVHPQSSSALREHLSRLAADERGALVEAEVCEDDTLAPGDCRLDTEFGSARAGVEAQLERLAGAWGVDWPPATGART